MRIQSVRVKNFRSLKDAQINFNNLTALIGSNGAGKSSFVRALDLFYTGNASYVKDDFYDRNIEEPISVRVEYTDLSEKAKEKFKPYIGDETLTVEKVMEFPDNKGNQRYHGNRLYNPDFDDFRNASGQGYRQEYEKLQENGYGDLPGYQRREDAETELRKWEENNPDQCDRRRDDGQFFGFTSVGRAALEDFTRYIMIPAVRDAGEDADDKRGSPLTELMDVVVRATLSDREEIEEFQQSAEQDYREIIEEASNAELGELEEDLSTTLGTFAPGVGVNLEWNTDGIIDIQMPQANVTLEVDDFESGVEHAGHGSQRAFIISLLQNLALTGDQSEAEDEEIPDEPSLILGIEEPELYQHPNRQRHLMSILSSFEDQEIAGAASSLQAIYTTHSPLMVKMDRFDDIRCLSKISTPDEGPKETTVKQSSLEGLARDLEDLAGVDEGEFSGDSTRARLEPIMTTRVNEGFFSDAILLVEGLEDRAAILGRANARDISLSSDGIAVLPCNGKTKMDKPAIIFEKLGKPVYVMFDSDDGDEDHIEINRRLQQLMDADEIEDWPSGVHDNYACFQTDLTEEVRVKLGEEFYIETLEEVCEKYGYTKPTNGRKNPTVMSELFDSAERADRTVPKVDDVIDEVIELV